MPKIQNVFWAFKTWWEKVRHVSIDKVRLLIGEETKAGCTGGKQVGRVALKNITKKYSNGVVAVKDFSLESKENELIVLDGPSGSGKSSLVRMIAGLEEVTSGEVLIDDVRMNEKEPKDRGIALVFQNNILYPEMTVYDNLKFPLKYSNSEQEDVDALVRETAELLELSPVLNKKPNFLTKEQTLRAVLGRALVRRPKVLILDEPLKQADEQGRSRMGREFARLHRKLNTTTLYVASHPEEAQAVGGRLIVMENCDALKNSDAVPGTLEETES